MPQLKIPALSILFLFVPGLAGPESQRVTSRFPSEKLRDENLSIEHGTRGAYRTEFYLTYDYVPVRKASKQM